MRPDEHKKKHNEQYKRKHGIKHVRNKVEDRSDVQKARPCNLPATTLTNETCDKLPEDGLLERTRPTFQRRKVQSNWDRYTEMTPSSLEFDDHRGADFKEILAQSSGAISQFRFKDEQEWENETELTSTINVLSVNCDDIMCAISCVPLHERLQIDTMHFQELQLKQFHDEAALNKNKYYTKNSKSNVSESIGTHSASEGIAACEGNNLNCSTDSHKNMATVIDPKSFDQRHVEIKTKNHPEKITSDNSNCRDELDDILNLEIGSVQQTDSIHASQIELNDQTTGHAYKLRNEVLNSFSPPKLECDTLNADRTMDDLDALLNLNDDVTAVEHNSVAENIVTPPKGKTENLEDWLDSVLDD